MSPGTGGKGTLGVQAAMESCWTWRCCLQSMAGIETPQPLPHGLAVHSCSLRNSCCHGFSKENTSLPPFPTTTTPHLLNLVTAVMTWLPEKGHFT